MTDTKNGIKHPEIKRQVIAEEAVGEEFEIKDSKGKAHKAQEVQQTEVEIDATHLIKVAPLTYFSPDNNKVYWIPFSIQFSVTDFLKQTATMAGNLEKLLMELQKGGDGNEKK